MNLKNIILFFLIVLTIKGEIVTFDKELLNKIYQENQLYIIYVHGSNHNFQAQSIFNSHCFGEKLCAILDPNNPEYDQFLQFIGCEEEEFFLIFDPASQRKFVSPITSHYTDNDLLAFEYKFTYKQLQPFFASQPIPEQNQLFCQKLVGKNLGEFLRRKERVKVILLYHLNEHCPNCDQILQQYIPFAEKNYEEGTLAFGYFNTFINDSPVIQDEKAPSFLVFLDQKFDKPFQLDSGNLKDLELFLEKTLKAFTLEAAEKKQEKEEVSDGEL